MYDRINQRVDIMINDGLLAEAEKLYPHKELNALQTVGYRELFAHFDGESTLDFAIDEIKKNTRRFSKRQLTWFKRTENAQWFDFETDRKTIINYIQSNIIHNS
jgi:tRNA dimethylallyltransferase